MIPQDFYLSLMKGDSSGRCYPLVRAMSVALARNGQAGADILIDKLYIAAADPESRDALLLQSSLKNLHSNINAVESSFSHGVMELKQIQTADSSPKCNAKPPFLAPQTPPKVV
ncbi:hypothetical protein [Providencia rustigianii]|uniref:hypothetical protein n=1 Tax=Providencia rustigianii TaxID=158850 RepID=UPI00223F8DF4|nr:hypothetical protein [Providencia rustigianii]